MAVSGSQNFTETRDEIVKESLQLIGGVALGEDPTPEQVKSASTTLNALVKGLQSENIHLWTVSWNTQTLTASSVVLGSDGYDYKCIRPHTSSSADKPITGANYTTYWKKLTTSAGSAWVTATSYVSLDTYSLTSNTVSIEEAFVRRVSGTEPNDTPLNILTREEYFNVSNKTTTGQVNGIWFENGLTPMIHLTPFPDNTTDVIHFSAVTRLDDFDATANTPDFDTKWLPTLNFGLAYHLSFKYGLPAAERQLLYMEYERLKNLAKNDSNEQGDLTISPDLRGR